MSVKEILRGVYAERSRSAQDDTLEIARIIPSISQRGKQKAGWSTHPAPKIVPQHQMACGTSYTQLGRDNICIRLWLICSRKLIMVRQ